MTSFSSLQARLVGAVLLAIIPAWVVMYVVNQPWTGLLVGLSALAGASLGGERFILRQVRSLCNTARHLASGNLSVRTGLTRETGELGELARSLDSMAESLEQRVQEREKAARTLLARSFQQTVVGALGQFALVSKDLSALLNQAAMLVSQTLEVEYTEVLELQDENHLLLRAGIGWKGGVIGTLIESIPEGGLRAYTLASGETVAIPSFADEARFRMPQMLLDHGAASGITVAISGHGQAFGLLGAYSTHRRAFTEDEGSFLLSVATVLAMGVARNRAEADLQKLAAFAQLNPNPAMELTADGTITYFNSAAARLAESLGLDHPNDLLPPNIQEVVSGCLDSGKSVIGMEARMAKRAFSWSFHPVKDSEVVHTYVEDITERLNLEAQLRQSQKMESIGQLAAGVAHDFNNMLTIIQGHSGMLLNKSTVWPDLAESCQSIYGAAERAAGLTRQLLMFSRKSVIQPKLVDLREVITNMTKMLQRILGETIKLEFPSPPEIPLIYADAGMLEQIIMNLSVNARDAMPKGGLLTISTGVVTITEDYIHSHPDTSPGEFVYLRVSDTGAGMDPETVSRIFEPFFTTKEVGKGTGLGLATVYGIAKQHSGWVEVNSETGRGTTFDVFFPAREEKLPLGKEEPVSTSKVEGGQETILLVEDEPVLREMAQMILEEGGYRILEAGDGVEALRIWEEHREEVDLLLTDMVMPEGMSGMDLAQCLQASKPELRVIFASGYSMDDLDTKFLQQGYAGFIQKPYTHVTLAKAVREALDQPATPANQATTPS